MAVDMRNWKKRVDDVTESVRPPIVLELDVTEGLIETPPADPISAALAQRRPRLQATLQGLARAASDPRVAALVVKVGGTKLSMAHAQELRDAVAAVRAAGKRTVAWSETFGEFGVGNVPYLLATACERIYLQPSGDVGLTGIGIEEPFLHDALENAGVTPQLGQRHEYKTAANTYVRRGYTDAHRDMTERIVTSLSDQVITVVAAARGKSESDVRELIDRAPLLAEEALDAGLVDELAYRDEIYARIRRYVGTRAHLMYVGRYHRSAGQAVTQRMSMPRGRDVVALITGTGVIRLGRGSRGPLGPSIGSDTVSSAFRAAIRNDRVKAIVFRVDSPGGSYVASDAIWRHVALARRYGTAVVVSMGRVAASGGYFVSMGADAIVALPSTLTGSIGVLGGKAVTTDLAARIGLTHDSVAAGEHALMFSSNRGYSDSEWARLNASLDRIYADFTAKVAEGRGLDPQAVEDLARGRVWTGADAREHGLVDHLGGLDRAVEVAKERAGLRADADADVQPFPHVPALERLRQPRSSEDATAAGVSGAAYALREAAWGRFAQLATTLGLPDAGPLTLPGTWHVR